MRRFVSKYFMFFVLLLVLFQPVEATARQTFYTDAAYTCIDAAQKYEKEYQIKEHLLSTITSVETGRWDEARKRNLPWPWTVNAEGKGQYFKTKAEAIKEVKRLQEKGVKSIDVGCMQINLSYHGGAFKNLEEAFDPDKNVEYGAQFLKKLYDTRADNWFEASKFYHSSSPKKGGYYKKKVLAMYDHVASVHNDLNVEIFAEQNIASEKVITGRSSKKASLAHEWREAKLAEYRKSRAR